MSGERDRPLRTLPTVLNVSELCQALRVGDDVVRSLVAAGRLRRLAYSRNILVSRDEVWRFLREATVEPPATAPIAKPPADDDGMAPPRQAPHRKGTRWPLDAQGGASDLT